MSERELATTSSALIQLELLLIAFKMAMDPQAGQTSADKVDNVFDRRLSHF
jgi:hypothetical protein